jgi:hypothetical protein
LIYRCFDRWEHNKSLPRTPFNVPTQGCRSCAPESQHFRDHDADSVDVVSFPI